MALPARALALLSLLPVFAAAEADAPVAGGETAHEQESGECEAAMRVELLQKPGAAAMQADPETKYVMTKSTFALSGYAVGKSHAFKRFFLPVVSEQEYGGNDEVERDDFLSIVRSAIAGGAALPDRFAGHSADEFRSVAWPAGCGAGARVRLVQEEGPDLLNMAHFSFHGVYAEGNGTSGSSHREVGGLTVRDVERIFQEELGDMREYSPWMDMHVAFYDNDLDSYASRFFEHDVPVLALRWPSADRSQSLYSLIVHVPDTQEVFEIVSAVTPAFDRLVLREFSMTRHVFQQDELRLLMRSSGPTQLHVSRSHYDLDAVKTHYKLFFDLEPVHEVRDGDTGVSFVSFWHQSGLTQKVEAIRTQVIYWNRADQSMTKAHTTAWLERRLEQLNSQYMRSYESCWPIWGDNHYTISDVSGHWFDMVRRKYDDAGIGYMLFQREGHMFTGYFPLPGGMYVELMKPTWSDEGPSAEGIHPWVPDYCFSFTCPA
jgi:hypothetical protein